MYEVRGFVVAILAYGFLEVLPAAPFGQLGDGTLKLGVPNPLVSTRKGSLGYEFG
jgi:hypothetical protein